MKLFTCACLLAASLAPLSAQEIYRPGDGVSVPTVIKQVKAEYTSDAQKARIEGMVMLEGVVRPDGKISDVVVIRSLDSTFGLDQHAVSALRQWLFKPGRKNGKDVAVRVQIEMRFTLK
jgi:TonB family protein